MTTPPPPEPTPSAVAGPSEEFVARHTTELSLPDGTALRIRPILPDDKRYILGGFDQLSAESRRFRFFRALPFLSADMLAEFTELDYVDRFAWIAFVQEPEPQAVGVARYTRMRRRPQAAEAAVTVIDPFQHRGIGTILLQALTLVALESDIVEFHGHVLIENQAMRGLLHQAGARIEHDSPGVLRFEIDLPGPAEDLRRSALYSVLRAVAVGEA
jgi:RimJ/RimL family protein N-acetyltransferase